MKIPYYAAVAVLLLSSGCQNSPAGLDQLKTEMRYLEDQLYWYDDEYRQKCAELESCRRENKTLRKELAVADDTGVGMSLPDLSPAPSAPSMPSDSQPKREAPRFQPPTIEPGVPTDVPPPLDGGLPASPTSLSLNNAEMIPLGLPEPKPETEQAAVDAHVTHIILNSRLTGGDDFDGRPGDEGLQVVVEPRNAAGRYVALGGPVSIVVLDPAMHGPDARIARWDFDAKEATALLKRSMLGRGIHLRLPWPNEPPENTRLHLYVRYVTIDGRKLEADRKISIELTGEYSSRWTPASIARQTERTAVANRPSRTTAPLATPPAEIPADIARQTPPPTSRAQTTPEPATDRSVLISPRKPLRPGETPIREATRRRPAWQPQR